MDIYEAFGGKKMAKIKWAKDDNAIYFTPLDLKVTLKRSENYFLCSWDNFKIIQVHTKETLQNEFAALFENDLDNAWYFDRECFLLEDLIDYLIETVCFDRVTNENMSIQLIKEGEK